MPTNPDILAEQAREVLASHGIVDGFNLPVLPGYTVAVNPDAVIAAMLAFARSSTIEEECARIAESMAAPKGVPQIDYDQACHDIAAAIRARSAASPKADMGIPITENAKAVEGEGR